MHIWGICFVSSLLVCYKTAAIDDVAVAAIKEFQEWFKTEHIGLFLTVSIYNQTESLKTGKRNNVDVALVYLELKHGFNSHHYVYITMRKVQGTWQLSGVGPLSKTPPNVECIGGGEKFVWDWTFAWHTHPYKNGQKFIRELVVDSSNGRNTILVYKKLLSLYFEAYRTPEDGVEKLKYKSSNFSCSSKVNEHIIKYVEETYTAFRLEPWTKASHDLHQQVERFSYYHPKTKGGENLTFEKIRQYGDTPDKFFLLFKLELSSIKIVMAVRLRKYFSTTLRLCSYWYVKNSEEDLNERIIDYLKTDMPFLAETITETEESEFIGFLPWIRYNLRHLHPKLGELKLVSLHSPNENRCIGVFAQMEESTNGVTENGYVWASAVRMSNNGKLLLEAVQQQELDSEIGIAKGIKAIEVSPLPALITEWLNKENSKKSKQWKTLNTEEEKIYIQELWQKVPGETQQIPKLLNLEQLALTETKTYFAIYNCEGNRTLCVELDKDIVIIDLFEIYDKLEIEAELLYFQYIPINPLDIQDKKVKPVGRYHVAADLVRNLITYRGVVGDVKEPKVQKCILIGNFEFLIHTLEPQKTEGAASKLGETVIFAVINPNTKGKASSLVLYVSPPLDKISAKTQMRLFIKHPKFMIEDWTKVVNLPNTVEQKLNEPNLSC